MPWSSLLHIFIAAASCSRVPGSWSYSLYKHLRWSCVQAVWATMTTFLRGAIIAAVLLIVGSTVDAGRSLQQDAPTDQLQCDVAVVGGGPGKCTFAHTVHTICSMFVLLSPGVVLLFAHCKARHFPDMPHEKQSILLAAKACSALASFQQMCGPTPDVVATNANELRLTIRSWRRRSLFCLSDAGSQRISQHLPVRGQQQSRRQVNKSHDFCALAKVLVVFADRIMVLEFNLHTSVYYCGHLCADRGCDYRQVAKQCC